MESAELLRVPPGREITQHFSLSRTAKFRGSNIFVLSYFTPFGFCAELSGFTAGKPVVMGVGKPGRSSTSKTGGGKAPGARDGKTGKKAKAKPPPAAKDDVENDDDPLDDAPGVVQHGDMTWRMLIASEGGLLRGGGVEAVSSTVSMDDCIDSAEYGFLQKSEAELSAVEQGAAQARNGDNLVWFSDTVQTMMEENLKDKIKDCANGVQVCTCLLRLGL